MDSVDQVAEDTLRGQSFKGKIVKYDNPNDLAYGDSIKRECSLCFYRAFEGNTNGDCHIEGDPAKKDFGFKPEEFLPAQLDGKEVGNYCPHFVDFRAE